MEISLRGPLSKCSFHLEVVLSRNLAVLRTLFSTRKFSIFLFFWHRGRKSKICKKYQIETTISKMANKKSIQNQKLPRKEFFRVETFFVNSFDFHARPPSARARPPSRTIFTHFLDLELSHSNFWQSKWAHEKKNFFKKIYIDINNLPTHWKLICLTISAILITKKMWQKTSQHHPPIRSFFGSFLRAFLGVLWFRLHPRNYAAARAYNASA